MNIWKTSTSKISRIECLLGVCLLRNLIKLHIQLMTNRKIIYISGATSYSKNPTKETVKTWKEILHHPWCFRIGRSTSSLHHLRLALPPISSGWRLHWQESHPRFQIQGPSTSCNWRGFYETRMFVRWKSFNIAEHWKGLCKKIHFRGWQKQIEQ